MALKKTLTRQNQFGEMSTLSNCYIRVGSFSGNKENVNFKIDVLSSDKTKSYLTETYSFAPQMNNENIVAQAYVHLKTLPDFSDAEDV